jgi:hypothetical protein
MKNGLPHRQILILCLSSQRRSCSIQQQQNPDTPIAIHRSLADSQHACADALIVRTYVDPAAHSRLRTVGGARSGSSGRILSAQICTTVQPYRIRVSVSAVRGSTIRSVDPRSPTRSPVSSSRVRRSIPPTSLQAEACFSLLQLLQLLLQTSPAAGCLLASTESCCRWQSAPYFVSTLFPVFN